LLLSGLMMPHMSGMELHEELRRRQLAPFRFALITGATRAVVRRVAQGERVLFKPVSGDDVRRLAAECADALPARPGQGPGGG
jgi:CheY-like chemotaxis protein